MTTTSQPALDDALLKQLSFKPGTMRQAAVAIARHMLASQVVWSDEVDLSFIQSKKDKNCIGGAWRQLRQAGIISRCAEFRRSTKKESRGRTVFKWRVESMRLAETFLARNGAAVKCQQEFNL